MKWLLQAKKTKCIWIVCTILFEYFDHQFICLIIGAKEPKLTIVSLFYKSQMLYQRNVHTCTSIHLIQMSRERSLRLCRVKALRLKFDRSMKM